MGRKKQRKNGFTIFLDEYIEREQEKGRKISYRVGAEECALLWSELSDEEKQVYSKMARSYNESLKGDKGNKLNSFGVSCAQIEREDNLRKEKMKRADDEIISTINNLDSDSLKTQLFYIVHCNYYCRTNNDLYLPGEIAICEFNLRDGIKRTYHTLVNPGEIPLGFAYETQQNINEVHKLPYPPYSEGNSDYFAILQEILNFLKPGELPDGRFPPLHCLEKNAKAAENILHGFELTENDLRIFRIHSLEKMFFHLKNKCAENSEEGGSGFPVLSNAILEIEKDVFCYLTGISCNFHCGMQVKYQNCSLSIVRRFAYVICDHCCRGLKIAIVPGKHFKSNDDLNQIGNRKKIEKKMANRNKPETCLHRGEKDEPKWTSNDFLRIDSPKKFDGTPKANIIPTGDLGMEMIFHQFEKNFPPLGKGRRFDGV